MARDPDQRNLLAGSERPSQPDPAKAGQAGQTDEGWGSTLRVLGRLAGIGWFVAISIAASALGGYWLDRWLDTSPWLTVAGVVLGVAVAFTGMVRLLRTFSGQN